MKENPTFSVCIAAYGSSFLKVAIDSVLRQEYESFELIVGDDSGGALRSLVESYKDHRVKYLLNPTNLGYAKNTWTLMVNSTGKYTSLLQHDDVMQPGFLESAAHILDHNQDVGVFLGGSHDIDVNGSFIGQRPTSMSEGIIPDPLGELLRPDTMVFLPSATVVRRAAVLLHTSPWPDNAIADYFMYIELAQASWKFYYSPKAQVGYRVHANQLSDKKISHRSSIIDLWGRFKFSDHECETKRINLLAKAFSARAGAHTRLKHGVEARRDLESARSLMPSTAGWKWRAIWIMTYLPGLVPPVISLWEKIRDPHTNRHKGF